MKKRHLIFILVSLVSLAGIIFFWWTKFYLPRVRHNAEKHWAAIGRPMPEFEKQLRRVEENDSLRALTRDLEPFGVKTFYNARKGEQDPNTLNIPKEITDVLRPATLRMGDQVDLAEQEFPYLENHAADLARLYQGILEREPAVWNFVPQDGMTLRVASFLTARKISQLICVDALTKLEKGDEKGAADALAAGLKMTSNLGEQPILVSQMIRAAIEALFAQIIARLPEDSEQLNELAREVERKRERWRTAMQTETWAITRVVDYLGFTPDEFRQIYQAKSLFEKIQVSLGQSLMEDDRGSFVACVADQVRISEQVRDSAISDLGVREMREASSRYAPALTSTSEIFGQTWYRAWIRLNLNLLLREQAELIRTARVQVQAGKSGSLGETKSVVVPGATWRITGDADTNSVSLKLTPLPAWTTDNDGMSEGLFLLPLDGSKWWKYRRPAPESEKRVTSN